jgi:hypothetical protein
MKVGCAFKRNAKVGQSMSDEKTLAVKLSPETLALLAEYANHVALAIRLQTGYDPGRVPRAIVAADLVKRGLVAYLESEAQEAEKRTEKIKEEGPIADKIRAQAVAARARVNAFKA